MFNKLARRLIIWAFKDRIKIFSGTMIMSEEMLEMRGSEYIEYAKRDITRNIADTLYKEGAIRFTEEHPSHINGMLIRARLVCLK